MEQKKIELIQFYEKLIETNDNKISIITMEEMINDIHKRLEVNNRMESKIRNITFE